MTEHTFTVTIGTDVEIPAGDQYGRTPLDYARAALNTASLIEARNLDGYADLKGDAWIMDVQDD